MEDSKGATKKTKNGIRLRWLNIIFISLVVIFSVLLTLIVFQTRNSYREMREATDRYIVSQQDAANMQTGSDYLTEQVRAFVITGERIHVQNFFEEVEVTQRRDKALANVNTYLEGTESIQYLNDAMALSNSLVQIEYYAMRLAIEAFGYDITEFPDALQAITLSDTDRALPAAQQAERARNMVFDSTYQDYKTKISTNVNLCIRDLIATTEAQQALSAQRLQSALILQEIFIVAILLLVLISVVIIARLMIRPIEKNIACIQKKEILPERGAYELRFLAKTYNQMYSQTMKHQDMLSYAASHDDLTNLYNRSVFDHVRASSDESNIALILIDLDHFKNINDTYGHNVGDLVLKRLASVLQAHFRSDDYVCRIGGDEFAVIMKDTGSALRDLIAEKIHHVNMLMQSPTDNTPVASLSAGVAFGDRKNPTGNIYEDADIALYRAKDKGRNCLAFYEDPV